MKRNLQIVLILAAAIQLSFRGKLVCEQVNSSLGYAEKQAVKAQESSSINLLKHNTYKAIGTLQKLNKQLESCGCETATYNVKNGLTYLKSATKTESISTAKQFLKYAKKEIDGGIEAIKNYNSKKDNHTTEPEVTGGNMEEDLLENLHYPKIDLQLENFKKSMMLVAKTSDCKKSKEFTMDIYENCVKNLLKPNLPKSKIYYYLKTKKIAQEYLIIIGDCEN